MKNKKIYNIKSAGFKIPNDFFNLLMTKLLVN